MQTITAQDIESGFFKQVELDLECHQNFQHGLEDAATAFIEEFEDCDIWDMADAKFNQGALWAIDKLGEPFSSDDSIYPDLTYLGFAADKAKIRLQEDKIKELEQRLAEAEKVIEFYGHELNWQDKSYSYNGVDDPFMDSIKEDTDYSENYLCAGGKRAREYQAKYKQAEKQ